MEFKKSYAAKGNPFFTEDKQETIAEAYLYNESKKMKDIAEEFDCSITLVHRFVKNYKMKKNSNN